MFTIGAFEGLGVGLPDGEGVIGGLVGAWLPVGLSVGLGPLFVGASVGAGLKHLSEVIPKQASPGMLHPNPEGQASASQQFSSASADVAPQKNLLKMGDLVGLAVVGATVVGETVGVAVVGGVDGDLVSPAPIGLEVASAVEHSA